MRSRLRITRPVTRPRSAVAEPLGPNTCGLNALAQILGTKPSEMVSLVGADYVKRVEAAGMRIDDIIDVLDRVGLHVVMIAFRGRVWGRVYRGETKLKNFHWSSSGSIHTPGPEYWVTPDPPVPGYMARERIPLTLKIGGLVKGFRGRRFIARIRGASGLGHAVAWHPRLGYYDNQERECLTHLIGGPRNPGKQVDWFLIIGPKSEEPQKASPEHGFTFSMLDPTLFPGKA